METVTILRSYITIRGYMFQCFLYPDKTLEVELEGLEVTPILSQNIIDEIRKELGSEIPALTNQRH